MWDSWPPPRPKVDPYRRTTDSDSQSCAITDLSAGPWKCLHFFLITHENLGYNKIKATSLQIGVQSRNIKQGFGDCTCKQVERDQCELCRWKRKESIPLNPRLRPTNRAPSFGPIRYGMLRHLCHVMWSFKWLGVSRGERVLLDFCTLFMFVRSFAVVRVKFISHPRLQCIFKCCIRAGLWRVLALGQMRDRRQTWDGDFNSFWLNENNRNLIQSNLMV